MKTAVPRCNSKTAHCCTYYDWRGRNEGWGGGDGEGRGRWVEGWRNKNRKIWKIMTAQIPTSGRTCTFKGVCDLASVEMCPDWKHAFFSFCQYNILFLSPWTCSYMLVLLWSRHVHREVWGCINLIKNSNQFEVHAHLCATPLPFLSCRIPLISLGYVSASALSTPPPAPASTSELITPQFLCDLNMNAKLSVYELTRIPPRLWDAGKH